MWSVVYLPADHDWREDGFSSKEDAWKWVAENAICKDCKDILEKGYEIHELEKGVLERDEVDHPSQTGCGCEWIVLETNKLNECESLGDIFEAAGFKKVKSF